MGCSGLEICRKFKMIMCGPHCGLYEAYLEKCVYSLHSCMRVLQTGSLSILHIVSLRSIA